MKSSEKGDVGITAAMADLSKKSYSLFLPVGDHQAFDLIVYKDGKCYRLQAKYRANGVLNNSRVYFVNGKLKSRPYKDDEFDYYALYLPDVEKVVYPSIKFRGCTIASKVPDSPAKFYWYGDFLDFTEKADKRSRVDFGYEYQYKPREKGRKVVRPNKEELEKLVWEKPTTLIASKYGVSDKAVDKWCKYYQINKPGRGHWKT